MRRARSMAHAAWTHPPINLSSWSCMGPRRRLSGAHMHSKESGGSPRSAASGDAESSDPLLSPKKVMNVTAVQNMDLPISSSVGEWSSEIECSCADRVSPHAEGNADLNDGVDIMELETHEDKMTEVELWQQLEHELYDSNEGEEADVIKEMREEEAAMAETTDGQTQSSALEMKEVHRFFPAGKIMHIVTIHPDDDPRRESDGSSTSMNSDDSQPDESKIGIFLTSRSLYSKLRLSQTMISDHFMPVYRRRIERLIQELEEEESNSREVVCTT